MLVGALVPFHDTGGDPDTVREYAQALEAAGSMQSCGAYYAAAVTGWSSFVERKPA
jgi:hypothetical protein